MSGYCEFLVKKKNTPSIQILRSVCLVLCVITFMGALFLHWMFLAPFVVLVVLNVVISRFANLEYEYLLAANELSVDKIMNQQKRKQVCNIELETIGQVIPADDLSRGGLKAKGYQTRDFSSSLCDTKIYSVVCNNQVEYLMNLNEKFLEYFEESLPVGSVKR
jgi:hypothetical protein